MRVRRPAASFEKASARPSDVSAGLGAAEGDGVAVEILDFFEAVDAVVVGPEQLQKGAVAHLELPEPGRAQVKVGKGGIVRGKEVERALEGDGLAVAPQENELAG
jgi:hypothetical protein